MRIKSCKMPSWFKRVSVVLGTVFGIGWCPVASGTCGTLAALILCIFLPTNSWRFLVIIIFLILISIPVSYAAEQYFGREDDGRIVIDELTGFMIAVAFIPKTGMYFAAAFALFRLFDICKFSYIKKSQRLPYGIGVVTDDVLAGLASNLILQITRLILKYIIQLMH
ncbi:MAG: phosphatidylglycerophosphatase A [bacterium]